jgi:hypothetical protein
MAIPEDETGDVLGADHVDEGADPELLASKPPCFPKHRHRKQAGSPGQFYASPQCSI